MLVSVNGVLSSYTTPSGYPQVTVKLVTLVMTESEVQ